MRIVHHCADRVGPEMAGPGIRAVELARRLAAAHRVVLVAPGATDLAAEPFEVAEPPALQGALEGAGALVTQGFGFPLRLLWRFAGRLVLDLYDPVQLEQLAQFGPAATPAQRISLAYVRVRLLRLLRRADHVLCASPLQRALWLGWLGAAGRLTPDVLAGDPEARALVAVVPFGVPDEPPQADGPALRTSSSSASAKRLPPSTEIAHCTGSRVYAATGALPADFPAARATPRRAGTRSKGPHSVVGLGADASVVFHRARPTPRHEAGERCPKGCWLGVVCKAVSATRSVSPWCHEPVQ